MAAVTAGLLFSIFSLPSASVSAGRTATSVINTLLNGKGVPDASLGINGDFYIDKTGMNLYGPKASGKWPLPVSMRGSVGPMGPVGVDGKAGEKGVAATPTTGSKGETGAIGATGATGAVGAPGSSGSGGSGPVGATGATGATGLAGATGASGINGVNGTAGAAGTNGTNGTNGVAGDRGLPGVAGVAGDVGAAGLAGTNGAQGLQGSQGSQGVAGAVGPAGTNGTNGAAGTVGPAGATGPSEVVVFNIVGPGGIDPWTFSSSGGSPESISSDFGSLRANKSYKFTIVLTGYVNLTGWNGLAVGSALRYTGALATVNSTVAYSQGKVLLTGALKRFQFTYLYEGTIVTGVDGNNLNVSVIDGENWSNVFITNGFKIVGTAYIQLIGGVPPIWSG